ncbi:hypothetical protein B7494_g4721 [Chlorociboria aeruginascens]|nr:hypothetical protein B7494_g4721 [Chlorociboria aeruginascens]
MAVRYTPEELIFLKDSPLVVKPPGLPPAEQWMGPPADPARSTKLPGDRSKNHDSGILPENRRTVERHISRNSANPDDIILGPPKISFMSATSNRSGSKPFDSSDRPPLRDGDSRDRYSFHGKDGENIRDGRTSTLRPKRLEGDQDNDGWSTVKPRKSFGAEGAERFNGRIGGDRHREDRKPRDREDRERERGPRGFDSFSRDKDIDHEEGGRRNGTARGRNEPSWFKDNNDGPPAARDRNSNGDRMADRSRGWREKEKDRDDRGERTGDRGGDRRWNRDKDHHQERDPEWMDEPAGEKIQAHTQEDFQKWKEQMQGKEKIAKAPAEEVPKIDTSGQDTFFGMEKSKIETPKPIDTGPDKFFGMWAGGAGESKPDPSIESKTEGVSKAKMVGKASRFTSFWTAPVEEAPRRQTEPPPPVAAPPSGFEALFSNNNSQSAEKEAFQQLLQKLQSQSVSGPGSTPPINAVQQPKPPPAEKQPMPAVEPFQQYRSERQDDGRPRTQPPGLQDVLAQRQVAGSQPQIRPEQMVQDLVGQRQIAASQSSVRPNQPQRRDSKTDFLMGLMQSAKSAPEPQRTEQLLLGLPPQRHMDRQMQQMIEREQEMHREAAAQRERSASQRRPQPPPGFLEDPAFQRGPPPPHEGNGRNPSQPTQILQRPPPGLDQMQAGWAPPGQQQQQLRHLAPPPGLAGGPGRGMPMPQQMYPSGFPMGNFPPPEAMGPPRNMPPPGFFPPPPPGFLPPGMGGFQGPEGLAFPGPYDGRGPPQGAFRRQ